MLKNLLSRAPGVVEGAGVAVEDVDVELEAAQGAGGAVRAQGYAEGGRVESYQHDGISETHTRVVSKLCSSFMCPFI